MYKTIFIIEGTIECKPIFNEQNLAKYTVNALGYVALRKTLAEVSYISDTKLNKEELTRMMRYLYTKYNNRAHEIRIHIEVKRL